MHVGIMNPLNGLGCAKTKLFKRLWDKALPCKLYKNTVKIPMKSGTLALLSAQRQLP